MPPRESGLARKKHERRSLVESALINPSAVGGTISPAAPRSGQGSSEPKDESQKRKRLGARVVVAAYAGTGIILGSASSFTFRLAPTLAFWTIRALHDSFLLSSRLAISFLASFSKYSQCVGSRCSPLTAPTYFIISSSSNRSMM